MQLRERLRIGGECFDLGRDQTVQAAAFSGDGAGFVIAGDGKSKTGYYDLSTAKRLSFLQAATSVRQVAILAGGRAFLGLPAKAQVNDLATGKKLFDVKVVANTCAASPSGSKLALTDNKQALHVLAAADGASLLSVKRGDAFDARWLDEERLLVRHGAYTYNDALGRPEREVAFRIVDLGGGSEELATGPFVLRDVEFALSPDRTRVFLREWPQHGYADRGTARLLDARTMATIAELPVPSSPSYTFSLAFVDPDTVVAVERVEIDPEDPDESGRMTLTAWDLPSGRCLDVPLDREALGYIDRIVAGPDGQFALLAMGEAILATLDRGA